MDIRNRFTQIDVDENGNYNGSDEIKKAFKHDTKINRIIPRATYYYCDGKIFTYNLYLAFVRDFGYKNKVREIVNKLLEDKNYIHVKLCEYNNKQRVGYLHERLRLFINDGINYYLEYHDYKTFCLYTEQEVKLADLLFNLNYCRDKSITKKYITHIYDRNVILKNIREREGVMKVIKKYNEKSGRIKNMEELDYIYDRKYFDNLIIRSEYNYSDEELFNIAVSDVLLLCKIKN